MVQFEEITDIPDYTNQLENKILYTIHPKTVSISYESTYTLKYIIEGEKQYSFNNQDIKVLKNQYLILNSKSKITTEVKRGTKGLSFFLAPELIHTIYSYHTNKKLYPEFLEVIQETSTNNIGLFLDNISYLFTYAPFTFKHQIDELFIQLCETIISEQITIDERFSNLKIIKYDTKKALLQRILWTKEYLHDNMSKPISLETLSKTIGVSKYYLHRLFTELTGTTPLKYLTYIRLEEAKNKLRHSKHSIFEIATECGFDSISYFSNTFKKYVGCSPSQYRSK
ncbi:MAG: AraC family transcriptional regulator [Chitinophagales bacterium]|nr:AraC family transcriptional regulator [Chitinophagales bacterium]